MNQSFETPQRSSYRSTINIVNSPDNRDSILITPESTSNTTSPSKNNQPPGSPKRKFNPFGHSRSHSHTTNNNKKIFYPIHHDGRYSNNNTPPPQFQHTEPPPPPPQTGVPKRQPSVRHTIPKEFPPPPPPPTSGPLAATGTSSTPLSRNSSQSNWTSLIPPMPGKPEPSYNSKDSLHQLKQNRDFESDEFNFSNMRLSSSATGTTGKNTSKPSSRDHSQSVSDNYSRNIPTNNPFLFREKRSDLFPSKSSLDPSQRHSIAVSPTPEKQSSKSNSDDSFANYTDSMMPGSYQRPPINKDKSLEKKSTRKKSRKICAKCGLEISSQFVRALQSAYHVDCFTCHECGKQCSAKFFPYEIKSDEGTTKQVALCEYDYFKKLDLICFSCNSALRGPYITALGNKYHLEHFKCHVCQRVFDSDESYYEHNNNIYCHYHYSKLYASHCEGCQSSIVKQFVELFRGGRNQHWHPECYMVHKFWNVCITPDSVGLQKLYDLSDETLNSLKLLKDADDNSRSNIDSNTLVSIEQQIEQVVMRSWLALSGYEEMTAKCISDMLLYACTGNKFSGIVVTGKLVLNVEVLFNALDYVLLMCNSSTELLHEKYGSPHRVDDSESSSQEEEYFQMLKKEPRNITGKIMSYLAILRKSDHIAKSGSLSAELLSVITGCAHYLKLLIRIGLFNALKLNKLYGTTNAIEKFLQLTLEHEAINLMAGDELTQLSLINSKLTIPPSSTDACSACAKSIEKSCLRMNNNRWHIKCFICSGCDRLIPQSEAADTKFDLIHQSIICKHCYCEHYDVGFQVVSDLSQLIYLLKIALFRSRSVMKIDLAKVPKNYLSSEDDYQEGENEVEDNYSQTLNDVTSLRSKRQSQKLSKSVKKKARKSIIVEAPEADNAKKEEYKVSNEHTITEELNELSFDQPPPLTDTRKTSTASQLSFDKSENEKFVVSRKKSLKIRDEPQRQATNLQLDRTSDLLKNEKALTLDDIPRIVAAEQARDQRPNAFKHHNSLYQRQSAPHRLKTTGHHKSSSIVTPTNVLENILNSSSLPPAASDIMANENRPQKYYSELSKEEHFIVRHIAVDVLSRLDKFYDKDELMPLIQHKKHGNSGGTFWDKFRFGGASSDGKKDKTMAVFGVDLQMLTNKYGIDSDLGVGPSKLRIPIIVDDLIAALRQKDMSVEGIFRLNGNIKKLRELTEQINKNPLHSPDFSLQNAVQLAALMKKWLRELPDPLLTFGLYDYWISSQREQDPELKKKKVQLVYALLGRTNRNLLEVLLYFLSWVASFAVVDEETGSKMDILNLATVIAPNILISKSSSNSSATTSTSTTSTNGNSSNNDSSSSVQGSGDNYFLAIEVVNQLIEQHEEFSIVPNEIMEIYEKCKFDSFLENHHHHHSGNSNSSKRITSKEVMTVLESQNNNST